MHWLKHPGAVSALLSAPATNATVDCYSRAPIDKPTLLAAMQERFGLRYEFAEVTANVNATASTPHYCSLNTRAADFGYQPGLTSLDGISQEIKAMLPVTVDTLRQKNNASSLRG